MLRSTFPDTTAIDLRASRKPPARNRRGLFPRLAISVDNPWITGLTGFFSTALVLLSLEYEAPLRNAILFLSSRRF